MSDPQKNQDRDARHCTRMNNVIGVMIVVSIVLGFASWRITRDVERGVSVLIGALMLSVVVYLVVRVWSKDQP